MLVAFDLDNTLVDRAGAVDRWAWEFVAAHDLDETVHPWLVELDADGYANRHEVFATIARRFGLGDADALLNAYRERVVELMMLTSGATECLVRLRADGHRLAIVTNGSTTQQNAKIDRLGLRALVDAVVVSGTVGVSKPDPRIFELAAVAAGSSLDGAWMVGDSPVNDIEAAKRLGMRTVWIARGRSWQAKLSSPDLTTDDLRTVADAISVH